MADKRSFMLLPRGVPIPVGEREISVEGNKFKIYLPMRLNDLWKTIKVNGEKVDVYIIIKEKEEQA